jgi:serine/threonine-protein kinase
MVFVAGVVGKSSSLYLRSMDRLGATPIPGTEGSIAAFFSPDGEWLGFYGRGKLKKVRLDGGAPSIVCNVPDGFGASWGMDDWIYFTPIYTAGLRRVLSSGGEPDVLTVPDASQGESAHVWPEILPNGRGVLFTILTAGGGIDDARIALLSLDTGKHRILVKGGSNARYAPSGHIVYVRRGVLLAAPFDINHLELRGDAVPVLDGIMTHSEFGTGHFALSNVGTLAYAPAGGVSDRKLVWVDRSGHIRPLSEERRFYERPRLSPDGKRLAVTIAADGNHIWIYDLEGESFARLTFGVEELEPLWTTDGTRVVFRATKTDDRGMSWKSADGSGSEEPLTGGGAIQVPESWSPDGQLLFSQENPATGSDLFTISPEEKTGSRPFLQTAFNEFGGRFSPDGRFIVYESNESGLREVYVRPFPGPDGIWQISSDGGTQPVWARNGREIFYRRGSRMMAVAVETEGRFRHAKPTVLFDVPMAFSGSTVDHYDVTPDGQRFVMIEGEDGSAATQIHVVLNWFEELKERVPPNH